MFVPTAAGSGTPGHVPDRFTSVHRNDKRQRCVHGEVKSNTNERGYTRNQAPTQNRPACSAVRTAKGEQGKNSEKGWRINLISSPSPPSPSLRHHHHIHIHIHGEKYFRQPERSAQQAVVPCVEAVAKRE